MHVVLGPDVMSGKGVPKTLASSWPRFKFTYALFIWCCVFVHMQVGHLCSSSLVCPRAHCLAPGVEGEPPALHQRGVGAAARHAAGPPGVRVVVSRPQDPRGGCLEWLGGLLGMMCC
jgi:hypothetical protein